MTSPQGSNLREWYLPEAAYLDPADGRALTRGQLLAAARITAGLVAGRTTRFDAWASPKRQVGVLKGPPRERSRAIDQVFDWIAESYEGPDAGRWTTLQLYRGRSLLLEIDRDLPARGVFLSRQELGALQAALEDAGLPRDLYYPLSQRRTLIEPKEWGPRQVTSQRRSYSPLQWAERGAVGTITVPSEGERRADFLAICHAFVDDLCFRELVTLQRGRRANWDEVQAIRDLILHVEDVIDRTMGLRTESFQRHPTAGWIEPPTAWQALDSVRPALRRLHPEGAMTGMFGVGARPESWTLWLVDTEYEITQGVLYGPVRGTPTAPPPRDPSAIFPLARKRWSGLLDSDGAARLADDAGGARFRRGRGSLQSLFLRRVRGVWAWDVLYERWRGPYRDDLHVAVGVRSGAILRRESSRSLWLH